MSIISQYSIQIKEERFMKNRFLILLLAVICAAALPLMAHAESRGWCGVNVKWYLDDNDALTIDGAGDMDSYVGEEAPWGKAIKSVTIKDGVTSIGAEAFSGCSSLASAYIGTSVTTIGTEAFAYCSSLKNITIPDSVTAILSSAFTNCTGLTEVEIPDSVNKINERAFYKCYNLNSITIPESVTIIGDDAFTYCNNLTVYCYNGSTAYEYAQANGIPVVLLDAEPAPAPVIIAQPEDLTVNAATTATFTVAADGDYSYQWYRFRTDGEDWELVDENGNSNILSFTAKPWHNGNRYFCRVTNDEGTFTDSDVATLTVIFKPAFTLQPVSIRVTEGDVATFTVAADYAESYQWYYRTSLTAKWNTVKNNGTSATYMLVAQARHNGYQYCCKAMNSCDSTLSDVATLTVDSVPTIITQPVDMAVNEGAAVTFRVVASNTDTYQWFYRTSPVGDWREVINNGTSADYTFTVAGRHNGYQYRCLLTNETGSVFSDFATLRVYRKPVITVQPEDVTVNVGEVAAFSVTAVGADTYQWYYRTSRNDVWSVIGSSATEPTYTLLTETYHDGYQFRCLVKNNVGGVYSNIVTLRVNYIPVISKQPEDLIVKQGETAIFKVVSSNTDSYQWYYRTSSAAAWSPVLKNGTSSTYKLTAEPRHNHYQYRCLLKNSAGYTYSNVATLTVRCKPIITKQPTDVTVNVGEKATFEVRASGVVSAQWYYRVSPTENWVAVRNLGTSTVYSLTAQVRHNGYQYRCKLTNEIGSVFTKTVKLTVTEKPTITQQPVNVSANIGQKATFTVKALKATSFQWYYRNPEIGTWTKVKNNGTSSTYSLTVEKRHNRFQYRCLVSNSSGSVYSQTATLTVVYIPVITSQPQNVKVAEGETIKLNVVATNADSFQWFYRKTPEEEWTKVTRNSTSAILSFTAAPRHNGYQYRCRVKNAYGTVYSGIATVTVLKYPVITSQPNDLTVHAGGRVSFTVIASNTDSYQWYYLKPGETTWKPITTNGNQYFYVTKATAEMNGYKFKCELKNGAGTITSAIVTLTVN